MSRILDSCHYLELQYNVGRCHTLKVFVFRKSDVQLITKFTSHLYNLQGSLLVLNKNKIMHSYSIHDTQLLVKNPTDEPQFLHTSRTHLVHRVSLLKPNT